MRKQILCGFIVGMFCTFALLCTAKGVEAATKMAQTVNYPIYIDNVVWTPSTPALNVDGSTYLPLRAMSEALGVQIDWSKEYRRVDVYKTKKPGDFPIGDGSVPVATQTTTTKTKLDELKDIIKSGNAELGSNVGVIQEDDDKCNVVFMKSYDSATKTNKGQIRFHLTDMIYKSYDENNSATVVEFDKSLNVKTVSVNAQVILDTEDPKYTGAVNEFKKNIGIFQNSVLKGKTLASYLGLKASDLKK